VEAPAALMQRARRRLMDHAAIGNDAIRSAIYHFLLVITDHCRLA